MKSYKEFLIKESLSQLEFLLEGYFNFSDDFFEKLNLLRNKSDVAYVLYRDLISYRNVYNDKDLKHSWIDITDKDDVVSFLPELKVKDEDNPFTSKKRGEIKIGRLVRSLLKLTGNKASDKEIEDFVNLFKSTFKSSDENFEIVSGKDIPYWYNEENYYSDYGHGTLANSCMRDRESDFFDIYEDSETCRMLILTKNDLDGNKKLIGRSLVWRPKIKPDGVEFFMDRVYTMRDSDVDKFYQYADERKWLRKRNNNYNHSSNMLFILNGEFVRGKLVVNITNRDRFYPYCDTLQFLNPNKDEISNIGYHEGWVLIDTYGDKEKCDECGGSGYDSCYECNGIGEVDCDECYGSGEVDCDECDGDSKIECEECDGDGEVEGSDGYMEKCLNCDGSGEIDCTNCRGGLVVCEECNGEGDITCPECDGEEILCDDCTGLIKNL